MKLYIEFKRETFGWQYRCRNKEFLTLIPTARVYVQGTHNKFPDFFRMGTFIESTHMKL